MMPLLLKPSPRLPRLDGSARQILVVLRGGLPEAVLAQGLLTGLRLRHPAARIHVVAPLRHAKLIQRHPAFQAVLALPDGIEYLGQDPWSNPAFFKLSSDIRKQGFDLALAPSPQRDGLTDILMLASGAPVRVGWQMAHLMGEQETDSAGWDAFYTHLLPLEEAPHPEPERYRHFTLKLGLDAGPETLTWPGDPKLAERVRTRLGRLGWKGAELVGVWFPPQNSRSFARWREALAPVLERGFEVVLLGPGGGRLPRHGEDWTSGKGIWDLRAVLPLDEQFECLALCRVVAGTEGPWIYPCAARGVPQVVLAGGGEFGRHAPVTDRATVVCHPVACYFCAWICDQGGHRCLGDLPPEAVSEALGRCLDEPPERPRLVYRPPDPEGDLRPLDLEAMLAPGSVEVIRLD